MGRRTEISPEERGRRGFWAGGSSSISQACREDKDGGQTMLHQVTKAEGLVALRLCRPADHLVSLLKM